MAWLDDGSCGIDCADCALDVVAWDCGPGEHDVSVKDRLRDGVGCATWRF